MSRYTLGRVAAARAQVEGKEAGRATLDFALSILEEQEQIESWQICLGGRMPDCSFDNEYLTLAAICSALIEADKPSTCWTSKGRLGVLLAHHVLGDSEIVDSALSCGPGKAPETFETWLRHEPGMRFLPSVDSTKINSATMALTDQLMFQASKSEHFADLAAGYVTILSPVTMGDSQGWHPLDGQPEADVALEWSYAKKPATHASIASGWLNFSGQGHDKLRLVSWGTVASDSLRVDPDDSWWSREADLSRFRFLGALSRMYGNLKDVDGFAAGITDADLRAKALIDIGGRQIESGMIHDAHYTLLLASAAADELLQGAHKDRWKGAAQLSAVAILLAKALWPA